MILSILQDIPFTGPTWFVLILLGVFVVIFARASANSKSRISWEDLVLDSSTDKTSPYKLGYLVGVIISTWTIVTYVDKSVLTYDTFGLYLTYLLGGAGWSSFIKSKNDTSSQ